MFTQTERLTDACSDDIAQIVAWLSDDSSRWVSGQTISASGGYTMY